MKYQLAANRERILEVFDDERGKTLKLTLKDKNDTILFDNLYILIADLQRLVRSL